LRASHAAKRTTETLEIDGRSLVLSNDAKVLWPEDGYTKGDLIRYYRAVAPFILPHLEHRPLTMQRYSDGIHGESFFEKHAPRGFPSWIPTVSVLSDSGRRDAIQFLVCNDDVSFAISGTALDPNTSYYLYIYVTSCAGGCGSWQFVSSAPLGMPVNGSLTGPSPFENGYTFGGQVVTMDLVLVH
jgi:hypothetical protein